MTDLDLIELGVASLETEGQPGEPEELVNFQNIP
jgi:hypothetical protein